MNGKKSFSLEAIGFGVRALIEQVRLFVIAGLIATGIISLVVGVIAYLNWGFVQAIIASQAFKDYQECVGYNCAMVAYQSGATLMGLVTANFFSLLISGVVVAIFLVGVDLGFRKISLQVNDNNESSYKEIFSCFSLAPMALIAWLLYGIMVWVGWLLLVLPGFIALLRFAFFPYFIVDKNMGPIDALKNSYEITRHHMWDIFAFWVAMKIVVSLGLITWAGIFVTWPLSALAYAYFYRKLVVDSGKGAGFF